MHSQNIEDILAGPDIKQRTVGESQAKANRTRNSAEEVGVAGHTLCRPPGNIAKAALEWNPHGSRSRGRPWTTWRRTILEEIRHQGKTWNEVKVLAKNRVRWRNFVRALCSLEEWRKLYVYLLPDCPTYSGRHHCCKATDDVVRSAIKKSVH
jgi:hypothetical protein